MPTKEATKSTTTTKEDRQVVGFPKYCLFDFETTGLDPKVNQPLTSHHILLTKKLEVIDTFSASYQFESYVVHPMAIKTNKINLYEHHEKATPIATIRRDFAAWLHSHCKGLYDEKGTLPFYQRLIPIGHNVPFDVGYMKEYMFETVAEYEYWMNHRFLDTCVMALERVVTGVLPYKMKGSLESLVKHYEIGGGGTEDLHNAQKDAEATLELFKIMINKGE